MDYRSYLCDVSGFEYRKLSDEEKAGMEQINKDNRQAPLIASVMFFVLGIFIPAVLLFNGIVIPAIIVFIVLILTGILIYTAISRNITYYNDFEIVDSVEVVKCIYNNNTIVDCRVWSPEQQKYTEGLRVTGKIVPVREGDKLILAKCIADDRTDYKLITEYKYAVMMMNSNKEGK